MSQARSQPKYIQIAESLAKAIQVGELNPGDRLASDDDLAVDFSASRNTVVRALVRLRDEGLIERIQGAGTYVAENSKRTGQRFLYVGDGHFDLDTRDTVFGRLEAAIDMILRAQYDSQLELDRPLADVVADHKTKAIDHAIEARFDGCFVMPIEGHTDAGRLNTGWLERLKEAGLGVVLIDQDIVPHPDRSPYDLVTLDHMHAGLTVGRHLASKNPRKVLLLAPAMVPHSVARRADGIAAALADRAECVTVNIAGKSEEQIEEAIRKVKPDAIVGKDDSMAAAAMRVLYRQRRSVPDEIVVCGFDDASIASSLPVPLTSYRQPISEIAEMAIRLLIDRIGNPARPARHVIVSGELIERESTDR